MSLPSGYKRLEYIQSSGTQYIDTGFKPNQNTTIAAEFVVLDASNNGAYLYGGGTGTACLEAYPWDGKWDGKLEFNYGSVSSFVGKVYANKRFYICQDKTKYTLSYFDGSGEWTGNHAEQSFTSAYTLAIFVLNRGAVAYPTAGMKLYSCQIYDNGTLVRDFIPCQTTDGTIGLWDDVNSVFYGNAGTGTFTAGPEVVYEPDAPTNFAASVSGQTVALSWSASANATGYRLKRDGVQIAEQTGTTYTDTVTDGTTLCTYALTAYNDTGESVAVTLLVLVQLELVTDRTRADVANQTDKGFYNASDLNRVGAAVEYIAARFTALGYRCPVTVKKGWLTSDAPTASQLETYRQNIVTLRGQIAVMESTPNAPASMAGLNYVKANNIEQILLDLDALIDKLIKSWYFSGDLYAGEV